MLRRSSSVCAPRAAKILACAAAALALAGCKGKPDLGAAKSGLLSSIYEDRSLFDTMCGYPLDPMYTATTEAEVVSIDAEPLSPFSGSTAKGTAVVRLNSVHKKGESDVKTCEAKLGFTWAADSKYVTDRVHKVGQTSTTFYAFDIHKI